MNVLPWLTKRFTVASGDGISEVGRLGGVIASFGPLSGVLNIVGGT
jgi:hypothetical protein